METKRNKKNQLKTKKNNTDKNISNDEDDLLKDSINKVNDWYTYFNEHIERARNFLIFLYVDQWDLNIREARELSSRPTMEFNKITSIIRAILGENRNNSPALTVRGIGKDIRQKTVDIYEGLISHIQYESDADIVYQVAGKHGLEVGWGAARVVAQYESPESFDQCLRILPIMDFQAAFWDPSAQKSDKSDGDYCGVYTVISKEKFKKLYPEVENPQDVTGLTNTYYVNWSTRDTVMMAEIYYKEYSKEKLIQLSDGKSFNEKEAKNILEMQEKFLETNPDAEIMGFTPLTIVNEKEDMNYKIKYIKFVQNKILEKTDYPGRILPIPYFEGDSTVIDGEQIPVPYIQDAIDTQKLINYIGSEIAYGILRSRKETVVGTPQNFAGFENDWINPDQVQGYLEFNYDKNGGKPEFIKPPAFNEAFLQAYGNCTEDLKQVLGRYEESRGQESNAISGRAINARQRASNLPANVYKDNNHRGMKQTGKILIDMIPHVYDTERTVMVRDKDGKTKSVEINKSNGFKMQPDGDFEPQIENDLTEGKYDIEIRVDGSFDAQQAEAMDILIRLCQVNPKISDLIPDLIAEVSGLKNTTQLVERLRTLVPPAIIAKENGTPPPPPPQQPPDPNIMIQMQKNKIAEEQNQLKAKQLVLEEQKLMQEAKLAGIDGQVGLAKAAAEIHKISTQKDIAILNHANALHHK